MARKKLITVKDVRLALTAIPFAPQGFSVEVRPNGDLWVYSAMAETPPALTNDTRVVPMVPPSVAYRVLADLTVALDKSHGVVLSTHTGIKLENGTWVEDPRIPRVEIPAYRVGGVL